LLMGSSAVTEPLQRDLFGEAAAPAVPAGGVFAEVVFDRPLDHAYTYLVPEALRDRLTVGKRVQAPFGRGDKPTIGYCVGVTEAPPDPPVRELFRVLDDGALLPPDLLRLTRGRADYSLCGWGQVLNAVVPAGAKDRAGTRATAFLQAVPDDELP